MNNLVDQIASVDITDTFNPYSNTCETFDKEDAASTRLHMLRTLLHSAKEHHVDSIWIGRDLGYRGGRRTGLALTDDYHIAEHGSRWGLEFIRPTNGTVVKERTATVIWNQLLQLNANIFMWNVFPFHPHKPGNPLSNRQHNAAERRIGMEILSELISLINPKNVVCIGNDAASAVAKLQTRQNFYKVRHPSYGGHTEFRRQISNLYNI